MMKKSTILTEMEEIINKPMLDIGRAADLIWIHFGEKVKVKNYKGAEVEVGEFAIHFQCPWRLRTESEIVLGNSDIYIPKDGITPSEFDSNKIGMSRFDQNVKDIKKDYISSSVRSINLDSVGTLRILLDNELMLEAFPNSSLKNEEYWRFINNNSRKHIVMFEFGL